MINISPEKLPNKFIWIIEISSNLIYLCRECCWPNIIKFKWYNLDGAIFYLPPSLVEPLCFAKVDSFYPKTFSCCWKNTWAAFTIWFKIFGLCTWFYLCTCHRLDRLILLMPGIIYAWSKIYKTLLLCRNAEISSACFCNCTSFLNKRIN